MAGKEEKPITTKEVGGQAETVRLIASEDVDSEISKLVQTQREGFPDTADIQLWEPFRDPLKFPVFCNLLEYEYAWLDKNDKYRPLSVALEQGYWQIVTRSNHFQGRYSDFRDHGAVERMGMILVYRPRSLGDHLRQLPERRHLEISRAAEEGTSGEYYERTLHKGTEVSTGGEVIYAQEQPGEEGLQPTGAFQGKE